MKMVNFRKMMAVCACTVALSLAGCSGQETENVQSGASEPVSSNSETMSGTTSKVESSAVSDAAESETAAQQEAPTIPQAYAELLDSYYTALSENWNGETLVEKGVNLLVQDCGEKPMEDIGFSITDLDGDSVSELVIGTVGLDDDYCGKLILDLYTMEQDSAQPVFVSGERDRYYYAGDCLFANIGSSGAADTTETTFRYAGGKMEDMGYVTEAGGYVQMELTPFGQWNK